MTEFEKDHLPRQPQDFRGSHRAALAQRAPGKNRLGRSALSSWI